MALERNLVGSTCWVDNNHWRNVYSHLSWLVEWHNTHTLNCWVSFYLGLPKHQFASLRLPPPNMIVSQKTPCKVETLMCPSHVILWCNSQTHLCSNWKHLGSTLGASTIVVSSPHPNKNLFGSFNRFPITLCLFDYCQTMLTTWWSCCQCHLFLLYELVEVPKSFHNFWIQMWSSFIFLH